MAPKMIKAFAAKEARTPLESFEYEAASLDPQSIRVRITHCGICHSDVHLIDDDWGFSSYPLVPGHEIVGVVEEKGEAVTHLELNQRVGIGWQRASCGSCEYCVRGDQNLCPEQQATCVGHHGGFADQIVTDSRFAFALPEGLASENAAPLLCGGITVYSPLRHYDVKASSKVGVIGIGGLGHLALQFANAFGCEVTAFSSSPSKEAEARKMGAHHFVNSRDQEALSKKASSLDFILSTIHAPLDWNLYLSLLRPDGKLCFVGVPDQPISIPVFPLIGGRKSICGSPIGSRTMISEMLDFAARHQIQAQTEIASMAEVNAAVERVRKNQARYRMVLKN